METTTEATARIVYDEARRAGWPTWDRLKREAQEICDRIAAQQRLARAVEHECKDTAGGAAE